MHTSHQKLSRLVAAVVIAAGCVASSAGPSDAAGVRNGPIAFGRFDPALGDFSLWTADADGTHQRPLTTVPSFMPNWAPDGAESRSTSRTTPGSTSPRSVPTAPGSDS